MIKYEFISFRLPHIAVILGVMLITNTIRFWFKILTISMIFVTVTGCQTIARHHMDKACGSKSGGIWTMATEWCAKEPNDR